MRFINNGAFIAWRQRQRFGVSVRAFSGRFSLARSHISRSACRVRARLNTYTYLIPNQHITLPILHIYIYIYTCMCIRIIKRKRAGLHAHGRTHTPMHCCTALLDVAARFLCCPCTRRCAHAPKHCRHALAFVRIIIIALSDWIVCMRVHPIRTYYHNKTCILDTLALCPSVRSILRLVQLCRCMQEQGVYIILYVDRVARSSMRNRYIDYHLVMVEISTDFRIFDWNILFWIIIFWT